jgi:hypothetical protein
MFAVEGVASKDVRKPPLCVCPRDALIHVPEDERHPAGSGTVVTVTVAVLLVVLPALLLTTTLNFASSSAAVRDVVYVEEVAPLIGSPFLFH